MNVDLPRRRVIKRFTLELPLSTAARHNVACCFALACALTVAYQPCLAHGVAESDSVQLSSNSGSQPLLFMYLGAKHMVTGVDHLLYLLGVLFFLARPRDVLMYATLFALGHSTTLLLGVTVGVPANPILIDAVIGLSVAYKALENLGALWGPSGSLVDPRVAVLGFGLCHGLGLASKLREIDAVAVRSVENLVAFNAGVEIGQFSFLGVVLLMRYGLGAQPQFARWRAGTNLLLLYLGFVLAETQVALYAQTRGWL